MKINRDLAIKILKYLDKHPDFYFPFLVMNKEYSDMDDDFVEICPKEWGIIDVDEKYQTFELWENLQNLKEDTIKLMTRGFIEKITSDSLFFNLEKKAKKYRKKWRKKLCDSEDIEIFGENEFIGGKADAFEECLELIKN